MAKVVIDRGPAANQAIPAVPGAVSNISLSIVDRAGPVRVRGCVNCDNGSAATRLYTCAIRKNGVQVAETVQNIDVGTLLRAQVLLDHIDLAAVVGDIYTLEIDADAADAASIVTANSCWLEVEGLSQDAAVVAGVGPAAA